MYKILVVDDEMEIRNIIKEYATFSGFEVGEAADGKQAIEKTKKEEFDLLIVDLMMPNMDGFAAIKEIKKMQPTLPVIILSARESEYSKLFGFEIGADDYVTKPFSTRDLFARVNALLKRAGSVKKMDAIKLAEDFEIDFSAREVKIEGKKAIITPKEYDLLAYFVHNRGIAISREDLLREVWGYSGGGSERTVDTHVKTLRGNLGKYRDSISTVRGFGYKFDVEK